MVENIDVYRSRLQDDRRAREYSARFARGARRRIDRRERRAVGRILTDLEGCRRILDVPSGAGRFLALLASGGRHVVEVDAAREILRFGREHAREAGARADFVHGDATRLPLLDASADGVFCNRLLHHINSAEERASILRELHRVSRRWVVVSFFDYHAFGTIRRFLKRLKGQKRRYDLRPTLEQFRGEVEASGFCVRSIVPTGAVWVAQKFFVLEKR